MKGVQVPWSTILFRCAPQLVSGISVVMVTCRRRSTKGMHINRLLLLHHCRVCWTSSILDSLIDHLLATVDWWGTAEIGAYAAWHLEQSLYMMPSYLGALLPSLQLWDEWCEREEVAAETPSTPLIGYALPRIALTIDPRKSRFCRGWR